MYREQQKQQKELEKKLKASSKPLLAYEKSRGEALALYQNYHDKLFPGWMRQMQDLEEQRLKHCHDGLKIYAKALSEKAQVFSEQAAIYSDMVGLLNVVTEVNSFIVATIAADQERSPAEEFPPAVPCTSDDIKNNTWECVCSVELEKAKQQRALKSFSNSKSDLMSSVRSKSNINLLELVGKERISQSSKTTISVPSDSDSSAPGASPMTSGEYTPRTKPQGSPKSPSAMSGGAFTSLGLPAAIPELPPPVPDVPDDFFEEQELPEVPKVPDLPSKALAVANPPVPDVPDDFFVDSLPPATLLPSAP